MPECDCQNCQNACKTKPGWFAPGEMEKAAALLGMQPQEFFNKYLAIDFVSNGEAEHTYWGVAPAVKGAPTGEEYPFRSLGECVFFEEGRCKIHAAKPSECAAFMHDETQEHGSNRKLALAMVWRARYAEVCGLLGREPVLPRPTGQDVANLFLDLLAHTIAEGTTKHEPSLIVRPW